MKKCIGQDIGVGSMLLSQHINVFTSLEAPRVPSFRDFKLSFSLQAWLINSLAIDNEGENEVTQLCPTLCDPIDYIAYQVPPFMGFSSQEYWSELPFLSPGALPNTRSPTL